MKVSVINKQNLRPDQEEVLQKFMAFQEAMIEKDLEKLNEIICDNYTLRHMSGRTQTKQEFIDEVMDAGIVYATDAHSAGLAVVGTATREMAGQVIYPAAALKHSKNPEEARAFLNYLKTPESGKVFESVGFTVINKP